MFEQFMKISYSCNDDGWMDGWMDGMRQAVWFGLVRFGSGRWVGWMDDLSPRTSRSLELEVGSWKLGVLRKFRRYLEHVFLKRTRPLFLFSPFFFFFFWEGGEVRQDRVRRLW